MTRLLSPRPVFSALALWLAAVSISACGDDDGAAVDTGTDAASDTGADTSEDPAADVASDVLSDAPSDAVADVTLDVPADVEADTTEGCPVGAIDLTGATNESPFVIPSDFGEADTWQLPDACPGSAFRGTVPHVAQVYCNGADVDVSYRFTLQTEEDDSDIVPILVFYTAPEIPEDALQCSLIAEPFVDLGAVEADVSLAPGQTITVVSTTESDAEGGVLTISEPTPADED